MAAAAVAVAAATVAVAAAAMVMAAVVATAAVTAERFVWTTDGEANGEDTVAAVAGMVETVAEGLLVDSFS